MHFSQIIRAGAISGFLAVGLGALGAHALKSRIEPHRLAYFEKAVQYQFVHTLALFIVALLIMKAGEQKLLGWSAWAFLLGILCFSGSLYLLAITELITLPTAILGPITPIGGLFFMAGWLFLALSAGQIAKKP